MQHNRYRTPSGATVVLAYSSPRPLQEELLRGGETRAERNTDWH
jgi:hypothetical protein